MQQKTDKILERSANRELFFRRLVMMVSVAEQRGIRMIIENPWNEQTFLKANFVLPPTMVDWNRQLRGDAYMKPTAYWFVGCTPTYGQTFERPKEKKTSDMAKHGKHAGLCSEERSMITPAYARNFICDFILGKRKKHSQLMLFEDNNLITNTRQ